MDFNDTWQATLGELELTLSKANFTTTLLRSVRLQD